MATRIPVVVINGQLTTLPAGDTLIGSGGISIGSVVGGSTAGSSLFVGAAGLAEDNANFFWDETTARLGIGTNTPNAALQVAGHINFDTAKLNTFLGAQAGNAMLTGQTTVAIGYRALRAATAGTGTVAIGAQALLQNTAVTANNVAIGSLAMGYSTSGDTSVAIGANALRANNSTRNIAIGSNAMIDATAQETIAIGAQALQVATGNFNIAIGSGVLAQCTSGSNNIAMGRYTLLGLTTGQSNTAVGSSAMKSATTCSFNTAIGSGAGQTITSGSSNVFIGTYAGRFVTTGANNTYIGYGAGLFNTGVRNVCIGYLAAKTAVTNDELHIAYNVLKPSLIHGEFINQNVGFSTTDYAGGKGVLGMMNAVTIPPLTPSGGGVLYVNAGALYWKGSAGTVTLIGAA